MTAPTPPTGAARVRIEGTVTAVHSDGRFTLALPDGSEFASTATGSQLRRLGSLIGCRVLVLGLAGASNVDGVLPAAPGADPGPQFSASELAEMFATTGDHPVPRDEELEALLKDDR